MSSPHVIISAVHELDNETPKEFWNDEDVREVVENFDKEVWDGEWHMCRADFKSTTAMEKFLVETPYHSNRKDNVAEIVLDGQDDMTEISITGLDEIIEEINDSFDRSFTLEAYYWYDGVDKPGAVER